ncbi:hypothetical protein Gogos_000076 [Gossypium gossypioides]|uniref:Uncharacterized protein n=1 Tax=Gossypium gossypioides TaxID=34282 RepID=A0A7J9CY36_GOSGO|nr:hypothetical protein [Gossypium gossypioides]
MIDICHCSHLPYTSWLCSQKL